MLAQGHTDLTLYGLTGGRKYLDAAERHRFVRATENVSADVRLFCLTLCLSGGRISEVLALTPIGLDLQAGTANLITLKRRKRGVIRQVPLPRDLLDELDRAFRIRDRQRDPLRAHRRIWSWSRTTAWRRVKEVMAKAEIAGLPAMPKGLRHGFGVNAFQSLVPPHLVQRWLGHASLRTTAIYCDVSGPDERIFAERMWRPAPSRDGHLFKRLRAGSLIYPLSGILALAAVVICCMLTAYVLSP
ncbi:tyrosine-type recombinase/integrase [Bradyrhizobium iriomotense]|uniref:tyrosine-type recombinase/integrase n=1 Tax=Bradyrhizobium iriomotense TaxID=441950 RepID=UPI0024E18298|nr:site-specific integrase [Bradyrhizobium iriomotense]